MPAKKELKNTSTDKGNDVARVFALLALFFVSALVGVASGVGVTHVVKRFAFTAPQNAETIAQASAGKVLGETDFQIAQTAPFFDCAKEPYASSAVCKGEHPRLHITKATLPAFQAKIATYYKSEYQTFVSWVDVNFSQDVLSVEGLMSDYHAFIFQMGKIPGITYQRQISEYGQRAVEIMLKQVAEQVPGPGSSSQHPHDSRVSVVTRTYDCICTHITP